MEIKAFQGWRYRPGGGDVSKLIAPPYDILSAADKAALLAGSQRNIVAVDLPHVPPSDVGPDSQYQAAAALLGQWMASGVLARDDKPCLYAYQQSYDWAGASCRRRTLIAAVRLTEFGQGIWPHEKTFAGPKADRLKLTQATRVQLSPIFGFYEGAPAAGRVLQQASQGPPAACGVLGGVKEALWPIADEDAIAAVRRAFAATDIFIADGHHRYTTALNYRHSLGELPAGHPANYVMFVLAGMDDPGLIVLPTHRVISGLAGLSTARLLEALAQVMQLAQVTIRADGPLDADALLKPFGPHAMAFVPGGQVGPSVQAHVGVLKDLSVMAEVAGDQLPAWRALDVSILHRLVIERCLAAWKSEATKIDYFADAQAALAASRGADLAVLLAGTPLSAVKEVALAGATMPHKSTYFYPKPATGMVIYPL